MAENNTQTKSVVPKKVLSRSVQDSFEFDTIPGNTFTIDIGSFADDITAWGRDVFRRDRQLRDFWPTEPFLASAINSIVQARANLDFILDGPPRTVRAVQQMLLLSDLGKGWQTLQQKVALDLLTQDNGAFVEIVRTRNNPNAPVINLTHLDSGQCQRTGQHDFPVIYTSEKGNRHKLAWYQVLTFEDMPSPIQSMHGVQYSFLTRVLRAAQILKDVGIFKREKISGRNPGRIYLVGGVQTKFIDDKLKNEARHADNMAYTRYQLPVVIGSLDPNAPVSLEQIDLREVPDGFDEDATLKWYIANLALGAGADYQDFAPLPGGGLGSGQQSEILHRKSKGKGHETWRKLWEHSLNFRNILPKSVTFEYQENDIEEKQDEAKLQKVIAETLKIYSDTGILTQPVIWQMMQDAGILKPEYMSLLGQQDITPTIVVEDEKPPPTQAELEHAETVDTEDVEKALTQLDDFIGRSFLTKQIDEDVDEFNIDLEDLSLQLQNGQITPQEFEDESGELVEDAIVAAFLLASGKTADQLTDEDQVQIDEQVAISLESIPGLTSDIGAGNFTEEGGQNLGARVSIWGATIAGVWALGQLAQTNVEQHLMWVIGIADHCTTCVDLDSVVRTISEWLETPFRPQVRNGSLVCGGWECKCSFIPVSGPSRGALPSPAG